MQTKNYRMIIKPFQFKNSRIKYISKYINRKNFSVYIKSITVELKKNKACGYIIFLPTE